MFIQHSVPEDVGRGGNPSLGCLSAVLHGSPNGNQSARNVQLLSGPARFYPQEMKYVGTKLGPRTEP